MHTTKFEELKASGNLPSPTGVALEILKLTQRDNLNIDDLIHPVQADPALAGRILKLVNSASLFPRKKILSLKDAIIRLGFNAVSQLALTLSVIDKHKTGKCEAFDYQRFWSISLLRALAMREISKYTSTVPCEDAFTLGLITEIGQLALAQIYPREYSECLTVNNQLINSHEFCKECNKHSDCSETNAKLLLEEEFKLFQIDRNQITLAMLQGWGLSIDIIGAVQCFQNYQYETSLSDNLEQKLSTELVLASALAGQEALELSVTNIYDLSKNVGLSEEHLHEIIHKISFEWPAWKDLLSLEAKSNDLDTLAKLDPKNYSPESDGLRILIVDDDRIFLHVLTTYLTLQGHKVTCVTSPEQAFDQLFILDPQVIITDYMMEPTDGLSFCKALRANTMLNGIYIILITADQGSETLSNAFEAGVNDFISKPLNQAELDARLKGARHMVNMLKERTKEMEELRIHAFNLAATTRKLEKLSLTDTLTNLPNRRHAESILDREWSSCQRGGSFAIISLDLDKFKQVNDDYGHGVGDQVLIHFAEVLSRSIRSNDVACRIGGEEFIVIAPQISRTNLPALCERIRSMVEVNQPSHLALSRLITVSIGAAISKLSLDKNGWQDTLKRSDQLLYAAKSSGRNTFKIFNDNNRRHQRIDYNVQVKIKWISPPRDTTYLCQIINLSRSGFLFRCSEYAMPSLGDILEFSTPAIAHGKTLVVKVVRIEEQRFAVELCLEPKIVAPKIMQ